jgi:acetyltransferase-like isoleucine patch superfamily enzyme
MTAGDVQTGSDCEIAGMATVGYAHAPDSEPPVIGDRATIRPDTVIYDDVRIGDDFVTGHAALVREESTLGDGVLVGTGAVIDGHAEVGSNVRLQTAAYVPQETTVGDRVFLGPHAVLTNDAYPVREPSGLDGVTLADDVTVGANATVLPGVTVGEGSFVAAGAVVTEDVPPRRLAVGAPAKHRVLPAQLRGGNDLG